MKILLCVYSCNPTRGREQGRGWNVAWHLANLGHEVWALTEASNQVAIERSEVALPPNLNFVYIDEPPWFKIYSKAKFRPISSTYIKKLSYAFWLRKMYQVATKIDKDHNFDIVHHVTMGVINVGSPLWKLGKPFIMGPVGGGQIAPPAFKEYFLKWWNQELIRSLSIQYLAPINLLLRKNMKKTSLVLASNSDTAKLASKLGATNVELFLDNGLPEKLLCKMPSANAKTNEELKILWVAVLEPRKGLPLALEALSKVNPLIPFKLIIFGTGTQKHILADLLEKYNLKDKAVFNGYVQWREVFEAYRESDVLIFPSLRDSFGAQLFEAMSQSLPVITLDHQGAGDFVPDSAGIKVPVVSPLETVAKLTEAIEYLYNHPEARDVMGRVGYEFAQNNTWDKKVAKLVDYYQEVLQKTYIAN